MLVASGLLATLAAASHLGVLPSELTRWCGVPVLAGLAALPWIVVLSPVEPSILKLLLLSSLTSPIAITGAFALARERLGRMGRSRSDCSRASPRCLSFGAEACTSNPRAGPPG